MRKGYKIAAIICAVFFLVFIILCMPRGGKKFELSEGGSATSHGGALDGTSVTESSVDVAALAKKNSDIYGWLRIPGTDIDYPVLQSADNDELYLDHNDAKKYDVNGALFTEHVYNSKSFDDPVVVIYGHHLKSGEMFGNLQQDYIDNFDDLKDLIIYTPTEEIHYEVFAAQPFSNRHILYYYDCFKSSSAMKEFMEDLGKVRSIGAKLDRSVMLNEDDQLLILSTCLQGDRTSRFLVIGKRIK